MRTVWMVQTLLSLAVLWLPGAYAGQPANPSEVTLSYTNADGRTLRIISAVPIGSGKFPLFVWLTGTNGVPDGPAELRILRSIAEKGVVAVSVEYPDTFLDGFSCPDLERKGQAIFGSGSQSAIQSILKALPVVDPKLGIAVAGFSQGAWIARMAKRWNPNIRAGWLLSTGVLFDCFGITFPIPCSAYVANPGFPVRAVSGQHDGVYTGVVTTPGQRTMKLLSQLSWVTGLPVTETAVSKLQTFDPSGDTGLILVRDEQVSAGYANHGYFYRDNDFLSTSPDALDPYWDSTTETWGRTANEDWLIQHLGK